MGSCHRSPGGELVIAGFRLRLSRRPLRRGIIFRFCDISRVCGQENFPPISAPRWPRAGSSRTSSGRRPHDRVNARIFRGFVIFQGFAGRKISHRFSFAAFAEEPSRPKFGRRAFGRAGSDSPAKPLSRSSSGLGLGPTLHRRPAPGMRDPFGIAAWNRPQRNPQAADHKGPARVGANEESQGARSRNAAPIAEERSCKIA
jgi:hypothetical protein